MLGIYKYAQGGVISRNDDRRHEAMGESNAALMPLVAARAAPLARGIQALELRAADDRELPAFTPGAHVTVQTPSGVLRKYSLCNDCDERNRYVIAVKRETSGRGGSTSLVVGCA
jgi:phthalate 4,5-dioxygenase reductase subunit